MGQDDAAGTKIGTLLLKVAKMLPGAWVTAIPGLISKVIEAIRVSVPTMKSDDWAVWCDKLVTDKVCDEKTAAGLKTLSSYDFPWGMWFMFRAVFKVRSAELEGVMNVYGLNTQYDVQEEQTPHPAPASDLIQAMIIDPARSNENRAQMKRLGFSNTQIDNMVLARYRTVEEGAIRTNFLRGNITEIIMYERMRELGYTDTRTAEIIQTWVVLPGPGDLFEMVAKEAFEPDIYKTLGLDKEFPSEQVKWLKQQGISEEWAKKYWIAHWAQPSIGQGFEMLHRNVITDAQLDLLFRAVEIPDFWRDKLKKIAYNPYTRVDVRRMHDLGILKDQDLITAYMDLGYDSEKALNMANFTILFNLANEKELTRGAILTSYEEGLITETDTRTLLMEQDYSNDLANYYIALSDYNVDKKVSALVQDNLRDEFLLNIRSETSTRAELNKQGLLGAKIDALIDSWKLDIFKYQAIPSKSELDRFLVKGIITEGQFIYFMSQHGYSSTHTSWYLSDISTERKSPGRLPSRTDIERFYKKGLIDEPEYKRRMSLLEYDETDIDLFYKSQ